MDLLTKDIWVSVDSCMTTYNYMLLLNCSKEMNEEIYYFYSPHIFEQPWRMDFPAIVIDSMISTHEIVSFTFYEDGSMVRHDMEYYFNMKIIELTDEILILYYMDEPYQGITDIFVHPPKIEFPIPSVWETDSTNVEEYCQARWNFNKLGYYLFFYGNEKYGPIGDEVDYTYKKYGNVLITPQNPLSLQKFKGDWFWKISEVTDSTMRWESYDPYNPFFVQMKKIR